MGLEIQVVIIFKEEGEGSNWEGHPGVMEINVLLLG